jgi:trigger factor
MSEPTEENATQSLSTFGEGPVRVALTADSPVSRTLRVEVDVDVVDKGFDRAFQELKKTANVKGFRPGKVPRSVLERLYGASVPAEIERKLIQDTLADALELAGVAPLIEPDIEAQPPEHGKAFQYLVRAEVRPNIELPDFGKLRGHRPPVSVGEDEVSSSLETLRERAASLVEEAEGVQAASGHVLSIDFVGRIDGEPFEGGSGQNVELEIGSDRFIPGFEEQLIGVQSGEDREVVVSFPDDYGAEDLQGKQATFAVHVAALRRRVIPELDDEFAKDMGDFDSLEALRDRVKSDMTSAREESAQAVVRQSVMDSLIELTDFAVSPGVVERQLESQLASLRQRFEGQVAPDMLQQHLARTREEGRPAAERRVRERFLLQQVVTEQEIEVSDGEVNSRLDELAAVQGMDPHQMRHMAEHQGWREAIRAELAEGRALDFLIAEATVEEKVEPAP